MKGRILILEFPSGSLQGLVSALQNEGYEVDVRDNAADLNALLKDGNAELLIATGELPETPGPILAERAFDALSIPIFLVLNTAGEETQAFLRRHPGVIGVYYRPLNQEKLISRIRMFFERDSVSS